MSSLAVLLRRRVLVGVGVALVALSVPASALASEYALADVPQFIASGDATKLMDVGVKTTTQLLSRCATRTGRATVARATGLGEDQLAAWAKMSDLMRVRGIGPGVARLLTAAGVDTITAFRKADAGALATTIEAVNRRLDAPLEKVPSEESLTMWIRKAQGLSLVYEP